MEVLGPGRQGHWCLLYDTEDEHRAIVTPFIRQAFTRNEKVMYFMDTHNKEVVLDYLQNDGLYVNSFLKRGQLSFLTAEETYLHEQEFNLNHMIARLHTEAGNALREGYAGFRVTGEMTWALRGYHETALIAYETQLNQFFPAKCVGLCQYDRRRFSQALLLTVAPLHPSIIINNQIYHNVPYTTLEHAIRTSE